jgi:hypothetical protein
MMWKQLPERIPGQGTIHVTIRPQLMTAELFAVGVVSGEAIHALRSFDGKCTLLFGGMKFPIPQAMYNELRALVLQREVRQSVGGTSGRLGGRPG